MKHLFIVCILLSLCQFVTAQENNDVELVSINIVEPYGENITDEAAQYFVSKMQQLVTANGMADNGFNGRFVLSARFNTLSRDVTQTVPVRISNKIEITFMIGDVQENKLFATTSLTVSGVGASDTKSLISALQRVSPQNAKLKDFLTEGKQRIVDYYTSHCTEFITRSQTLADMQQYDEAIYWLVSVPNVCNECFQRCQAALASIYQLKVDADGLKLLSLAKTAWRNNATATGAIEAGRLTAQINVKANCYAEAQELDRAIAQKLRDDERKQWELQMKKYKDNQDFKMSIIDACRAIGVAWANNQPKSVVKNLIRYW